MIASTFGKTIWFIGLLATSRLACGQVSKAAVLPLPGAFSAATRLTTEAYHTERRAYESGFLTNDGRIVDYLWRGAAQPEYFSVSSTKPKPFVGAGYASIALLTHWASGGASGDSQPASQRDALYDPATLRMWSLIALQEGYKKCL